MLRFWHVSLLVLIALIWKVRSTYSAVDICDLTGSDGVYCNCQPTPINRLDITCFVFRNNITSSAEVWSSFDRVRNTVALSIHSRNPAQLTFVPTEALKNLDVLETLTIQEGNLGRLKKGVISGFSNLSTLKLERNEITALDRYSISNLPKLKKLTLSENLLVEILADSFSELDELENLYLDRNNISRIENCGFCNLQNLRELDLSTNVLMDLTEHVFIGLRYLSRLDLSYNHVKVLNEKVFKSMPRLVELNMEENLITYISPRAFHGLNELRILNLSHNKLKTLPDYVFEPLPKLLNLYLSHNELETLQEEVVESLHNALKEHFALTLPDPEDVIISNDVHTAYDIRHGDLIKVKFITVPEWAPLFPAPVPVVTARLNKIEMPFTMAKTNEGSFRCSCDLAWIPRYREKVKNNFFAKTLQRVKCHNEEGDILASSELELKFCDKSSKKEKTLTNPALSTLSSNFKGVTQANPKYESEYSDSAPPNNYTSEKSEAGDVIHENDNSFANFADVNKILLFTVVVNGIFTTRNF